MAAGCGGSISDGDGRRGDASINVSSLKVFGRASICLTCNTYDQFSGKRKKMLMAASADKAAVPNSEDALPKRSFIHVLLKAATEADCRRSAL